jgi:hypothetical protein
MDARLYLLAESAQRLDEAPKWPRNNTSGFAPVLVLPVLAFQLAYYCDGIRRSSSGGVVKFAAGCRASSLVSRLAGERRPGSPLK